MTIISVNRKQDELGAKHKDRQRETIMASDVHLYITV